MYIILGAGLAGISSSYHLGHDNCIVFEKNNHFGGHVHSDKNLHGYTWDEGPHVSFTKNQYVKDLFANNIAGNFLEYSVHTANYFKGCWVPHPAQVNLYAVPQPLRDECLKDLIEDRDRFLKGNTPQNYEEWLLLAFGKSFYRNFSKIYTKKYWTLEPYDLTIDWVGERIFYPEIEDVKEGYNRPLKIQKHYIQNVRYPKSGGFFSYTNRLTEGMNVKLNMLLSYISFANRYLIFNNDNIKIKFDKLISTIPLPELILKSDAPENIKLAAKRLACTSVLLINVMVDHKRPKEYNWMYVYDENMYSTRINCTEKLSPQNAPRGKMGIQVEVYFSKFRPLKESINEIAKKVCDELIVMELIKNKNSIIGFETKCIEWANVIFNHDRRKSLDLIFNWLSQYGLLRNDQDLAPVTDWSLYETYMQGSFQLAGRFAEWKYYWTDDCVLRGVNSRVKS